MIKVGNLTLIPYYPLIYRLYILPIVPIMVFLIAKLKKKFFFGPDTIQTHKLYLVVKPI